MGSKGRDRKQRSGVTVVFGCSPRHWSLDQTKLILRAIYYMRALLILKATVAVDSGIVKGRDQEIDSGVPK